MAAALLRQFNFTDRQITIMSVPLSWDHESNAPPSEKQNNDINAAFSKQLRLSGNNPAVNTHQNYAWHRK